MLKVGPIVLLELYLFVSLSSSLVAIQNLGGNSWQASGNQPPSSIIIALANTTVPGCVHLDWMKGKNITQVSCLNNFIQCIW